MLDAGCWMQAAGHTEVIDWAPAMSCLFCNFRELRILEA